MQNQNAEKIDLLKKKTEQIKQMSITIKDHLETEANTDLKNMSEGFGSNNPVVSKLTRQHHKVDWEDHSQCWN